MKPSTNPWKSAAFAALFLAGTGFSQSLPPEIKANLLLREKDPDNMEKLMDQGKSASKTVVARIQEAGASGGEIGSSFEALGSAN
jgi:hypothetical protein